MSNPVTDGHQEVGNVEDYSRTPEGESVRPDSCGEGLRDASEHSYDGLELPTDDAWWLEMGRDELVAELSGDTPGGTSCSSRPLPTRFEDLPASSALRPRVVIGEDDRRQIKSTTDYPWRCICSLVITAADGLGTKFQGTGWLAGPSTVITAGHVVFLHDHGGWARSIEVIPGRDGDRHPHGSQTSTVFRSVTRWTEDRDRSFDYGAIFLPPAGAGQLSFGERLGFFGLARLSADELRQLEINLAGYPTDKAAGTVWWQARRLESVASRTLTYTIDTEGGQSGSPLWRVDGGARQAVGIHVRGHQSGNAAVRINRKVFDNLVRWTQP